MVLHEARRNGVAHGHKPKPTFHKRILNALGPGLITGASDDDPSGIGTYSQAGAQLGFAIGWTMLFSYPLMVAIQETSARIGRTTGHGIAGAIRAHYPGWLLHSVVTLLFLTNIITIGADLSAMGDAIKLLIGGPRARYVVLLAAACAGLQIFVSYKRYAPFLKWMTLSLFAYFAALLVVKVDWLAFARGVLFPSFSPDPEFWTTVVAVLGTTISPYLFFWQAAQECEDIRAHPERQALAKAPRQGPSEIDRIRADTYVGMAVSNLVALAIIATTAATLHAEGCTTSAPRRRPRRRSSRWPASLLSCCSRSASSAPECWRFRCLLARRPMRWPKRDDGRSALPSSRNARRRSTAPLRPRRCSACSSISCLSIPSGRCSSAPSSTASSPRRSWPSSC